MLINKVMITRAQRKCQWTAFVLLQKANEWYFCLRARSRGWSDSNPWWIFIWYWRSYITIWIKEFIVGGYQFSPMIQYQFADEVVRVWSYLDRLMIHLILIIIRPTFRHNIFLQYCYPITSYLFKNLTNIREGR